MEERQAANSQPTENPQSDEDDYDPNWRETYEPPLPVDDSISF